MQKKYLFLRIYGWYISLKYGRYYWCRLPHTQKVRKDFEIKNLAEYHDLEVENDKLLLVDVFENFRNMCLKIYQLDPAKVLSTSGLAWQEPLKKVK